MQQSVDAMVKTQLGQGVFMFPPPHTLELLRGNGIKGDVHLGGGGLTELKEMCAGGCLDTRQLVNYSLFVVERPLH